MSTGGAKPRIARKSRHKSDKNTRGSVGQKSPSRPLVSRDTAVPVSPESMAFENRAFSAENENLGLPDKEQKTGRRETKSNKDKSSVFVEDEIF